MAKFRICSTPSCNNRLPDSCFDGHSKCARCIGRLCTLENRCSECVFWPENQFKLFDKHRHALKLARERRAKYKLAREGKLAKEEIFNTSKLSMDRPVHDMSVSPAQSLGNLPLSLSDFPLSPSTSSKSMPVPFTAALSAPDRGQVTTESEIKLMKAMMSDFSAQLATLSYQSQLAKVHSASVSPSHHSLHSSSGVDRLCDDLGVNLPPTVIATEVTEPTSEPCPTESCLDVEFDAVSQERGRKRFREPKDHSAKVKRSEPPSRTSPRTTLPLMSVALANPTDAPPTPACGDVSRVNPTDRTGLERTPVPRSPLSPVQRGGQFSDSMNNALTDLVKAAMKENPDISLEDSFALAQKFLKENDPLNLSFHSSRSVRSVSRSGKRSQDHVLNVTQDSVCQEQARECGNVSVEGGGCIVHDVTAAEVHAVSTPSPKYDYVIADQAQAIPLPYKVFSPVSQPTQPRKLVFDPASAILSTPRCFYPALSSQEVSAAKYRIPVGSSDVTDIPVYSSDVKVAPISSSNGSGALGSSVVISRLVSPKTFTTAGFTTVQGVGSSFVSESFVSQVPKTVHSVQAGPVTSSSVLRNIQNPGFAVIQAAGAAIRPKPSVSESLFLASSSTSVQDSGLVPTISVATQTKRSTLVSVSTEPLRPRPVLSMSATSWTSYDPELDPDVPLKVDKGTSPSVSFILPSESPVLSSSTVAHGSVSFSPSSRCQVMACHSVQGSVACSKSQASSTPSEDIPTQPVLSKRSNSVRKKSKSRVSEEISVEKSSYPQDSVSPPTKRQKSSFSSDSEGEDHDSDSDHTSVVELEEETAEDLLGVAQAYKRLKARIVDKYPNIKEETSEAELSPFQLAYEKVRPKSPHFKMSPSVKLRLAALDRSLVEKRSKATSPTIFKPFLKKKDMGYYRTDLTLDSSAPESVLALLVGILDYARIKNLKTSKVAFSITEIDSLLKSAFQLLETLSFASASFEILADCFMDLRDKLTPDLKPKALEYTSFLRCVDKAGRHSIGEAVNLFANLLLKKREHILSMSFSSISTATKAKVIFAPLAECKLLPLETVKETSTQFRQLAEMSALVSVVSTAKSQLSKSKSLFRTTSSSVSPLQDLRGKGAYRGSAGRSSSKRGYSSQKGYSSRSKDYFARRDRYAKGSKRGGSQPPKKD